LTGDYLSAPRYALTNPFGYYRFVNVPVYFNYQATVFAKNRSFAQICHVIVDDAQNDEKNGCPERLPAGFEPGDRYGENPDRQRSDERNEFENARDDAE
jgi:rRNA maturation protein Nop10